ncbi:hypothetical protein PLESTM_000074000 [Pleodorina starrii]|nr:hypothetical protein PLESTM_000074000 [Pleodorina starrii]
MQATMVLKEAVEAAVGVVGVTHQQAQVVGVHPVVVAGVVEAVEETQMLEIEEAVWLGEAQVEQSFHLEEVMGLLAAAVVAGEAAVEMWQTQTAAVEPAAVVAVVAVAAGVNPHLAYPEEVHSGEAQGGQSFHLEENLEWQVEVVVVEGAGVV